MEDTMEKKTMGSFIAALRKANGMTQQDLADRLNISNKAVSRWERDECAPDVMLIPALAEILGVTCDELLKGERILGCDEQTKSVKVEKQIKSILNRSLTNFTMMMWISIAVSLVGLICMFGIAYGAFRPDIGFVVMTILEVGAFILAAICTSKLKGKRDNELFESADETSLNKYNRTLGTYSYAAFCSAVIVVAISVPLIVFRSKYIESVLTFGSYIKCFGVIAPAVVLLFLAFRKLYFRLITGQPRQKRTVKINLNLLLMDIFQIGTVFVSAVLFLATPSLEIKNPQWAINTAYLIACVLLAVSAVIFIVFIAVCKNRKTLILPGIRTMALSLPAILSYNIHHVDVDPLEEWWDINFILLVIGLTLTIFMIAEIIRICLNAKKEA